MGCAALARQIGECTKIVNIFEVSQTALRDCSCFAIFDRWPQALGDEHSGVERKRAWPAICMKLA
jgi:hypothetical protein